MGEFILIAREVKLSLLPGLLKKLQIKKTFEGVFRTTVHTI